MAAAIMPRWTLLLYVVPARPTRLRAAVWREIKAAGAVYLRDGVCALPEGDETCQTLAGIARRVEEAGGEATLVREALLDDAHATQLEGRLREARAAEYADVAREAVQFVAHVRHELEHRDIGWRELAELEADMSKLARWCERARSRDTYALPQRDEVAALLEQCRAALADAGASALGAVRSRRTINATVGRP